MSSYRETVPVSQIVGKAQVDTAMATGSTPMRPNDDSLDIDEEPSEESDD